MNKIRWKIQMENDKLIDECEADSLKLILLGQNKSGSHIFEWIHMNLFELEVFV